LLKIKFHYNWIIKLIYDKFSQNKQDGVHMGKKIAVLASGNGSGFEAIYNATANNDLDASVEVVISNNTDAPVLKKAEKFGIDNYLINKNSINGDKTPDEKLEEVLDTYNCDYIFLSGFMKKISDPIVEKYKNRIINSHPSLLPKYGGKGMYGTFVHEAVIKNKETTTGVTIHFVNEVYDEGRIILQDSVEVKADDTPLTLEKKVKEQESKAIIKALKKVFSS
jgi:phosphoribosylglycinamide formyltransferase-1